MAKGAPYPFVLAHGFFGFEKFAGQDFITYFYKVKSASPRRARSSTTPAVDPFNDSDFRGHQLIDRIEAFRALTGAAKVNIIAHSQGGLDARVVAHDRPDLVASVVTIATPHFGTPVADIAMKLLADPNGQKLLDDLGKLIGAPLYDQIGNPTSVVKPLQLFSQPGSPPLTPNTPTLPVSSTPRSPGDPSSTPRTTTARGPLAPVRHPVEQEARSCRSLLAATSLLLGAGANDGLVRDEDAPLGRVLGLRSRRSPRRDWPALRRRPRPWQRLGLPQVLFAPRQVHPRARVLTRAVAGFFSRQTAPLNRPSRRGHVEESRRSEGRDRGAPRGGDGRPGRGARARAPRRRRLPGQLPRRGHARRGRARGDHTLVLRSDAVRSLPAASIARTSSPSSAPRCAPASRPRKPASSPAISCAPAHTPTSSTGPRAPRLAAASSATPTSPTRAAASPARWRSSSPGSTPSRPLPSPRRSRRR